MKRAALAVVFALLVLIGAGTESIASWLPHHTEGAHLTAPDDWGGPALASDGSRSSTMIAGIERASRAPLKAIAVGIPTVEEQPLFSSRPTIHEHGRLYRPLRFAPRPSSDSSEPH